MEVKKRCTNCGYFPFCYDIDDNYFIECNRWVKRNVIHIEKEGLYNDKQNFRETEKRNRY